MHVLRDGRQQLRVHAQPGVGGAALHHLAHLGVGQRRDQQQAAADEIGPFRRAGQPGQIVAANHEDHPGRDRVM